MTRSSSRLGLWLLLVAACAAALAGAAGTHRAHADARGATSPSKVESPPPVHPDGPPSEVIFPPQHLPLHFDHERHVGEIGLTCTFCHAEATTSRSSGDRLLPPPTRCDACHGTDHSRLERVLPGVGPAGACRYCHVGHTEGDGGHVARVVIPQPNLKFDHAVHHARGVACGECHEGVARAGLATVQHLPKMRKCLECHGDEGGGVTATLTPRESGAAAREASGSCDVCHLTESGSRLVTTFPTGQLLPPRWLGDAEHGPDWIRRHRHVAGANSTACASCHDESECVDCHDGRVRPRSVHPGDWLTAHAMATRTDDPTCGSCHRAQSFCIGCHERAGVAMSGPLGTLSGRGRFHPPESVWTGRPKTSRHHAWEAERNIQACVSCHTERDCASCHATAVRGGQGDLSPHPAGFGASCSRALSKNPRPCLYCHEAGDRSLDRCR